MKLKHIYNSSSEANHKTKKIVILFGSEKVTKINLPATKHKFHIIIHVLVGPNDVNSLLVSSRISE
jgi:hypothetical protein